MASEFFRPLDMGEAFPSPLPQFFHTCGEGWKGVLKNFVSEIEGYAHFAGNGF